MIKNTCTIFVVCVAISVIKDYCEKFHWSRDSFVLVMLYAIMRLRC